MVRSRPLAPPSWSEDRLEQDRRRALAAFIGERGEEGTRAYVAAHGEIEPVVRRLFDATDDLRNLRGEVFQADRTLLDTARFLAGPPVSADDLATLVGSRLGRKRVDPETADRVVDVLRSVWDPIRFPWLTEERASRSQERESAILWTAGIWAIERIRARRRTESSRRQRFVGEAEV